MQYLRNPRMNHALDDLMDFGRVVAVMPDERAVAADEGCNLIDVPAPTVRIGYSGSFEDAQILAEHDEAMVADLRRQGWEVLNGWSRQYSYAGPIMHNSESVGGGLAERILEEPGYWVALEVIIYADPDDKESESDKAGWIVARKIGSEDEIAARLGWIAEEMAPWHFDPKAERRVWRDEDVAMSEVQVFYKGHSETAARYELATYWTQCAYMNHVKAAGEDTAYLTAADKITTDPETYSIKPAHRTGRVRAYLKPKETA